MLIGHQKQWSFLKKIAEQGSLPHALLFCGQEKLGKKKIALDLAYLLLGEEAKNVSHPDLILIEPEARQIQISQIRDLIWKLSLKPYSSSLKVAIIDQAHFMNEEAQTCLLKTLEEPRGKTLLILISDKVQYLLPTIVSRTQTIRFYPVEEKEIRNYLKEQGTEEAEKICKISAGKPGVALELASDAGKLKSFEETMDEIEKISKSTLASRFQYAKDLSEDPKEISGILCAWTSYFRDRMLEAVRRGSKEAGPKYSLEKTEKILKTLQSMNFLISTTNVNAKLAIENLMLEL